MNRISMDFCLSVCLSACLSRLFLFLTRHDQRRQGIWLTYMRIGTHFLARCLSACLKSRSLSVACSMTYERRIHVFTQIWLPPTLSPRPMLAYLHVNTYVIVRRFSLARVCVFSFCLRIWRRNREEKRVVCMLGGNRTLIFVFNRSSLLLLVLHLLTISFLTYI
jgi:hypothetical protein